VGAGTERVDGVALATGKTASATFGASLGALLEDVDRWAETKINMK